jgi:hypothetical protein
MHPRVMAFHPAFFKHNRQITKNEIIFLFMVEVIIGSSQYIAGNSCKNAGFWQGRLEFPPVYLNTGKVTWNNNFCNIHSQIQLNEDGDEERHPEEDNIETNGVSIQFPSPLRQVKSITIKKISIPMLMTNVMYWKRNHYHNIPEREATFYVDDFNYAGGQWFYMWMYSPNEPTKGWMRWGIYVQEMDYSPEGDNSVVGSFDWLAKEMNGFINEWMQYAFPLDTNTCSIYYDHQLAKWNFRIKNNGGYIVTNVVWDFRFAGPLAIFFGLNPGYFYYTSAGTDYPAYFDYWSLNATIGTLVFSEIFCDINEIQPSFDYVIHENVYNNTHPSCVMYTSQNIPTETDYLIWVPPMEKRIVLPSPICLNSLGFTFYVIMAGQKWYLPFRANNWSVEVVIETGDTLESNLNQDDILF